MTGKARVVEALMRLYPTSWRKEYGLELSDLLLHRPLTVGAVADVAWNGLRQRVRVVDAATICGLGVMLMILTSAIWNVAAPSPGGLGFTTLLSGTSKTLPTVILAPLGSEVYVAILVLFGAWSGYRGASPLQSGAGALKMSLIAGLPIILVGLLMLSGLLGIAVLGPGGLHTTSASGALTWKYYSPDGHAPSALAVVLSPLFSLPSSWLWGTIGGLIGRTLSRSQHTIDAPQ